MLYFSQTQPIINMLALLRVRWIDQIQFSYRTTNTDQEGKLQLTCSKEGKKVSDCVINHLESRENMMNLKNLDKFNVAPVECGSSLLDK